jgi:hypothetical protein
VSKIPWIFVALCAAMYSVWAVTPGAPSTWPIFTRYFMSAWAIMPFAMLFWMAVRGARLTLERCPQPLPALQRELISRLPLLALPLFVFPFFMAGLSAAKSGIAVSGFRYDRALAGIDHWIFGADPWVYAHAMATPELAAFINFFYVPVWMAVLAYTSVMLPLLGKPVTVVRFYVTMMMAWLISFLTHWHRRGRFLLTCLSLIWRPALLRYRPALTECLITTRC